MSFRFSKSERQARESTAGKTRVHSRLRDTTTPLTARIMFVKQKCIVKNKKRKTIQAYANVK